MKPAKKSDETHVVESRPSIDIEAIINRDHVVVDLKVLEARIGGVIARFQEQIEEPGAVKRLLK